MTRSTLLFFFRGEDERGKETEWTEEVALELIDGQFFGFISDLMIRARELKLWQTNCGRYHHYAVCDSAGNNVAFAEAEKFFGELWNEPPPTLERLLALFRACRSFTIE